MWRILLSPCSVSCTPGTKKLAVTGQRRTRFGFSRLATLVVTAHFFLGSTTAAVSHVEKNKCGHVPVKLCLWTVTFECNDFHMPQNIIFLLICPHQPFKNAKTILSSGATKIAGCGPIWPADQIRSDCLSQNSGLFLSTCFGQLISPCLDFPGCTVKLIIMPSAGAFRV